jgi:hypothetical protein
MVVKSPHMLGIFGWTDGVPEATDEMKAAWQAAEDATNAGLAQAYAALDEAEREELVSLCTAALAAVG